MKVLHLLTASLVAILWAGVLEIGLHAMDLRVEGSLYTQDATRRFHLRPRARAWFNEESETFVTINSRGFRDRERSPGPHPGTFRIAVVGDSAVAGLQVREEEMFTQVAERALASEHVEVLNFGVPNYGLAQQYLTLRDEIFAYRPNLVIEAVSLTNAILNSTRETCVNDSPYPYFIDRNGRLELYDPPTRNLLDAASEGALLETENRLDLALLFFKSKRVLTGMADVWAQRFHLEPRLPDHFYERSLMPPSDPAVSKAWDISERTIIMMRDVCSERGIPFWILTMDIAGQVDPDRGARAIYLRSLRASDPFYADSRIVRFAENQKIPYIQSAPLLADYASRTGKYLHGFFNTPLNYGHLNADGHAVLGHILADRVRAVVSSTPAL